MYNCGPTVYDYAHIGNFRAFVFADVLRRFLEARGYEVRQVMNITDVGHMTDDQLADGGGEDKMALALRRMHEAKKSGAVPDDAVTDPNDPYQIALYFTNAFIDDAKRLQLKIVNDPPQYMPRATGHIEAMQQMIARLLESGHAYRATDGAVYYSVESFPAYGALSGNTLEQLRGGAGGRVQDEHQADKRHLADFLLWKPDSSHLMKWDSPWGTGYPGWHIECSAMARTVLEQDTIDIHTGGEDNIFPHHECEIAQSTGVTNKPLTNLWMHTRFLLVEGQKMSKSKGNFYTVRQVLDGAVTGRPVDPAVLRFELLKAHYRSNLNFTRKGLEDSASAVGRLREAYAAAATETSPTAKNLSTNSGLLNHPVTNEFFSALADDLNVSAALGIVFSWLRQSERNDDPTVKAAVLRQIDQVLAVLKPKQAPQNGQAKEANHVEYLCRQLDAARATKNFTTADALRQRLIDAGYEVLTTKQGTTARRKLA